MAVAHYENAENKPRGPNSGLGKPPPQPRNEAAVPAANGDGGEYADKKPDASNTEYCNTDQPRKRLSHVNVAKFRKQIGEQTGVKAVHNCGRRRAIHARTVTLASDGTGATAAGIMLCKNSHLCPACAPWLARRRAEVLEPQITLLDGVRVFVTLTIERHLRFSLVEHNAALDATWRSFASGAQHKQWTDQAGGLSFVRAFETGYSKKTGWGGHFHILGVLREPRWPTLAELGKQINRERRKRGQKQHAGAGGIVTLLGKAERRLAALLRKYDTPIAYLMDQFTKRFREAAAKNGIKSRAIGQDWQIDDANKRLGYITKGVSKWDVLREVILGSAKTRSDMDSFWALADRAANGDQVSLGLVKEYAAAMRGRRMITVSRDLHLIEDDELEPGETEMVGLIDITDDGLKRLCSKDFDGVGLAKLLDMLPKIWRDPEAIELALGAGGFDLRLGRDWTWYVRPEDG